VITIISVVPFCIFRTTKTNVLVHLYPKFHYNCVLDIVRKALKSYRFDFDNSSTLYQFHTIPEVHSGIKKSVRSFARRMNCGKQRKRRR
jgi:hypothetical protein